MHLVDSEVGWTAVKTEPMVFKVIVLTVRLFPIALEKALVQLEPESASATESTKLPKYSIPHGKRFHASPIEAVVRQ